MAINQEIKPTNDPNFVNATRPISVPDDIRPQGVDTNRIMPRGQEIGDRSAEFEGRAKGIASTSQGLSSQAFGDLFAGVVGVGDFLGKAGVQMVKKNIENEVYEVADAERNLYMQRLEEIKNGGSVRNIVATDSSESLPSEISELPDQLSVLSSARDGGKISSTDYRARLMARAKDLRAKYPGFRQEIDAEFAKVTGMNPANAVITGLIADINRQGHTVASEATKARNLVIQNLGAFPDPADAIYKTESGQWSLADVAKIVAPHEKFKLNITERKLAFDDIKLTDEQRARAGGQLIDDFATNEVAGFVSKFTTKMGLTNEDDVASMDGRTKSGELNSQRWNELGRLFSSGVLELRQRLWDLARSNGLVKKLGADEVNKHIDAAVKRTDIIKERIFAADVGGIHESAKMIQAMQDDDTKGAMQDPIIGAPLRMASIAKRLGGDSYSAALGLAQAQEGLPAKFVSYTKAVQNAIATQFDMQNSGVPLTLNRVFDSYSDKMKDASPKEKAAVVNSTINRIKEISDPKTPDAVKLNYALAAFSEGNRGFVDRLNQDSFDAKGRPTRGKNAVYQDLTSEAMTKSIFELNKKHPGIWQKYVDWSTETIDSLTSRDARYLDQIRNPAIQVGWDSNNHRFVFNYKISDQERNRLHITRLEEDAEGVHVRNIINRLNNNLAGYRHIAEAAGGDVDTFVLGAIAKAVGPQSLSRVDGIPANIIRDIGLTRLKKKPEGK